MTTLAEILTEVYGLTGRPDLVSRTTSAVKRATLRAHHLDFFDKDMEESGIHWDPSAYTQSLDYKSLFPRWRAFKYLRKYDNVGSMPGEFFEILTVDDVLDGYKIDKVNICYLAGSMIEIKSNTLDDYMLIGMYLHPDVTDAGYSSWIADEYPGLIAYGAALEIFNSIGLQERAQLLQQNYAMALQEMTMSNLAVKGE